MRLLFVVAGILSSCNMDNASNRGYVISQLETEQEDAAVPSDELEATEPSP